MANTADGGALIFGEDGNESPEPIKSTGGAGHVADTGRANIQSHNRYIEGITSAVIKNMSWTAAEAVHAARFKLKAGGSAVVGDIVRIVFDVTPVDDLSDTVQAANWLAAPSSDVDADVESFELILGGQGVTNGYIPEWSDWFYFASPLRRADLIAETAARTYHVMAEVK